MVTDVNGISIFAETCILYISIIHHNQTITFYVGQIDFVKKCNYTATIDHKSP